MAFTKSKYKDDILGARQSVLDFGVSGIKLSRLKETGGNIPDASEASLGSYEEVADYSFAVLIVPLGQDFNSEQGLQELFGKEKALLVLEGNELTEAPPVAVGDQFKLAEKEYKIEKVKAINPDGQFPILFEAVVS